jgi:hypothetical protein
MSDAQILVRLLRQEPTAECMAVYVGLLIRLGVRAMWIDLDAFDR